MGARDRRENLGDLGALAELRGTVDDQLRALGAPLYEVVTRTRDDGVAYRHLAPGELLGRVADLRSENRAGTEVSIRPLDDPGLVLLRGLAPDQHDALVRDGFPPALTVNVPREAGDTTIDAWVRLPPMAPGLRDATAQTLAARYGTAGTGGRDEAGALGGFADWAGAPRAVVATRHDRPERQVASGAQELHGYVLDNMVLRPGFLDQERARFGHPVPERGLTAPAWSEGQEASRPVNAPARGLDTRAQAGIIEGPMPLSPRHLARLESIRQDAEALHAAWRVAVNADRFGEVRATFQRLGVRDGREVDYKAALQIARENPALTRAELGAALERGGAGGKPERGLEEERAAYIARTADRAFDIARLTQPHDRENRGGGRDR